MSSIGLEAAPSAPVHAAGLTSIRARTWTTVVVHGFVDFFSYVLIPLMPIMAERLQLSSSQVAFAIAIGSVSSGVIQPLVAWASDRLDTRWLGTLGFLAAVVSFSLLGQVSSYAQLLAIQLVGAAGIGAFHPVAAAAVGHLAGRRRSLGVAIFFLGGMLGGIAGNVSSPQYVKLLGLPALVYLMIPGVVAVVALGWAIHRVPHRHHTAHDDHRGLPARERRWRWASVWVLYAGNVLRFTVNMALVQLIIEWTQRHTLATAGAAQMTETLSEQAAALNGPLQAAVQAGMGAAGISAGWLLGAGGEKRPLFVVPALGALAILAFPFIVGSGGVDDLGPMTVPASFAVMILAGIGFGGVVPVTISLAQRLLPHRTSLASGLMMGGAWSVAAVGPPIADGITRAAGLSAAFAVVAGMLLASGLLALALPGWLIRKAAHH